MKASVAFELALHQRSQGLVKCCIHALEAVRAMQRPCPLESKDEVHLHGIRHIVRELPRDRASVKQKYQLHDEKLKALHARSNTFLHIIEVHALAWRSHVCVRASALVVVVVLHIDL